MILRDDGEVIRGHDRGDVTDLIWERFNRSLGDAFGRSGSPTDLSRCAAQPKVPAAIARKEEDNG